jgi:hypothetical protein
MAPACLVAMCLAVCFYATPAASRPSSSSRRGRGRQKIDIDALERAWMADEDPGEWVQAPPPHGLVSPPRCKGCSAHLAVVMVAACVAAQTISRRPPMAACVRWATRSCYR